MFPYQKFVTGGDVIVSNSGIYNQSYVARISSAFHP